MDRWHWFWMLIAIVLGSIVIFDRLPQAESAELYQPVIPIPQSSQSDQWRQNQQLNQDMMQQYKQHKPIEPQLPPSYYEYDSKTGITKWCLYLGNNMWSCR